MLSRAEILNNFSIGRNCAMITLGEFADQLGYDKSEIDIFARCFGGGMDRGNVCGAVTGAYMAIGAYADDKARAMELKNEFDRQFTERFGTVLCKELLGKDFSIPAEKEQAFAEQLTAQKCPDFISAAIEILEDILC